MIERNSASRFTPDSLTGLTQAEAEVSVTEHPVEVFKIV